MWYYKKGRYTRRKLSTIGIILLIIILLIGIRIYRRHLNNDDSRDRPDYCNQSMRQELLARNPIRSPFTYEISNNNSCSTSNPPHALIFVISKSSSFGIRNAIRRTWGNFAHITSIEQYAHLRLKLLFLLDIDESSLRSVRLEHSLYHDLVQVHLPQYYILSTYRDMAILHWTETYCSNALITMKTDDDVFPNVFLLANTLNYLLLNRTIPSLAMIYGTKIWHAPVLRHSKDPKSEDARYITTDDEYPCRYYPDYMSGFGYLVTRVARTKLLYAFFRVEKVFHLSDVYVTGILAEYMKIPRENLRLKMSSQDNDDCDQFFQLNNAFACASALHYKQTSTEDAHILQRFHAYWKRIYENRFRSMQHLIKY